MYVHVEQYSAYNLEDLDRKIFQLFDLAGNNLISDKEMAQILLTMPEQAIITDIIDKATRN